MRISYKKTTCPFQLCLRSCQNTTTSPSFGVSVFTPTLSHERAVSNPLRCFTDLKDGIELVLHTRGRREEIVELKWDMIKLSEGVTSYIAVNNLKVERQKDIMIM